MVLVLMALTALAASRVGEPDLAPGIGVTRNLPRQVGPFIGHEMLFCADAGCAEAFGADEFDHPATADCSLCGGTLDRMAPIERQLLPAGTEITRAFYRDSKGSSFFVSLVIGGRDRMSLHRPENCLPGQGLSIRNSRVLETPLVNGDTLRTRLLDVRRQVGGSDGAVFSHFTYWYIAPGRETPSQWRLYGWMAADRLIHARMDRWAYVAVAHDFNPLHEEASKEQLRAFLAHLHPRIVTPVALTGGLTRNTKNDATP